jgi:serine/threonine-protein kinase HipA
VDHVRGRPRLAYSEGAQERYAPGTPLLSVALPVRAERYPQGVVHAYIDGLLPEGEARRTIARQFNLRPSDTYGLIRALGRDCAGAVVIQPVDEPAPPPPTTLSAEPLTDEALAQLVTNLRSAPLGAGGRVRISLAGVQDKLLLTRMPDGRWGRPVDGTPSTHILKPEIAGHPDTVANEAFCMRIARHLGLEVASVDTTEVEGRKLLVVERYDRAVSADGAVKRIHQEDFCQATAVLPDMKYEEDGGPSLSRIASIVQAVAPPDSLERLVRAVTVNVLIGNGDAHAKNFSLLHEESGRLSLAPAYDVMSTLVYGDDRLALYIDKVRRINRVTAERIVNEAASWGMSGGRAAEIVDDILARASEAIDASRGETPDLPAAFVDVVKDQLVQLRGS